jgi:glycosyltransferase involved in cell wall biosynthesis
MATREIRILQFICPTGFYGAERWILALARNLDSTKIQCDLAVTLEENTTDLELVAHYRNECSTVGEAFEIPMTNRFDIGVIKRLVKLIKNRNIDIIHTHGYKSDILGIIAARVAGIKCIVTPHGFENASDLKLRLYIWLGCKAMHFAHQVAPLSTQIVNDVQKHGVRDREITYIQNGVDLSEIELLAETRTANKLRDGKLRIGFIGQMISRKNIRDILDIFNSLCEKHDNLELQLLGDGDQRKELERYATTLDLGDKIKFLGFQNNRLEYLANFDLFVMTSTLEGIPRCLMEAMAMGVPAAAYEISGVDQLIINQETGLLAKPGDKEALAEMWEMLLFDLELSGKLADNAKTYVHRHYSAKRMANEYADLYAELLP